MCMYLVFLKQNRSREQGLPKLPECSNIHTYKGNNQKGKGKSNSNINLNFDPILYIYYSLGKEDINENIGDRQTSELVNSINETTTKKTMKYRILQAETKSDFINIGLLE